MFKGSKKELAFQGIKNSNDFNMLVGGGDMFIQVVAPSNLSNKGNLKFYRMSASNISSERDYGSSICNSYVG